MARAFSSTALLLSALLFGAGVAACQGCRTPPATTAESDAPSAEPTVRLYLLSAVAGALEPCGCSKDQLGGIDHLAAFLQTESKTAPNRLVLASGPMLFLDPTAEGDRATQERWNAEAMAAAAKHIGLTAWAPGINDWAAGTEELKRYLDLSGATLLAGNIEGPLPTSNVVVRDVAGTKVGIVGVADPRDRTGRYPEGVRPKPPLDAMRAGLEEAKKQGARILVGLAALPRGEAMRLADELPELHVLALGKPHEYGHGNDAPKSPVMVGSTLVVETSNHLQSIAIVDLHLRKGDVGDKPVVFADAGGVAKADELISISNRIRDLENRINSWERSKNVKIEDLNARKADLARLRAEKAKLEEPHAAPKGSYFRYRLVEVREGYGSEPNVFKTMSDYYKRVNQHNKKAFADRKPTPAEPGKASYIGVAECEMCHEEEVKVWKGTSHSHAYPTLEEDFKEFNLDCVSCHVTGYGKPGGSTVTFVEKLKNVQCEECHGPGSLHAKQPSKKELIILRPDPQSCVSGCHHPPHVEGFDPNEKMKLILGPGHGMD
jgi:hypothetical protein